MPDSLPTLYSFRRCPYAMRARMAIRYSQLRVELREIEFKNKPAAMLLASPKATVPVLICSDQTVIDESLDIMQWALQQNDPDDWLQHSHHKKIEHLITDNDTHFKSHLDHYNMPFDFRHTTCAITANRAKCFYSSLSCGWKNRHS